MNINNYLNHIQKLSSDLNIPNSLFQEIQKYLAIRNHDNFVQCIRTAQNYLGQFFISDLSNIDFVFRGNIDHIIPQHLFNFCVALSDATGYDHYSCLMGILGIASIALNGKFIVDLGGTWKEPVLLYQLFLARSGAKKSAFIAWLKSALEKQVETEQNEYDLKTSKVIKDATFFKNELVTSLKTDSKTLMKELRLPSGHLDVASYIAKAQELLDGVTPSIEEFEAKANEKRPLLFVDGSSPLGLPKKMSTHQSLAICEPEPNIIDNLCRNTGNGQFLNLLLKAYLSESYSYTTSNKDIMIDNPRLNIMIASQPDRIIPFYNCRRNLTTGLIGRFNPIFINHNAYLIDGCTDRQYINSFKDQHTNLLISSYKHVYAINYPYIIQVSNEARQAATEFSNRNATQAKSLHPYMDSFMSKLAGTACRYAGIILLSDPTKKEMVITKAHMDSAIQIASLSIGHARYAIEPAGLQSLEPAVKLEAWYKSRNKCLFSYREAKQGLSSSLKKMSMLPWAFFACSIIWR